MTYRRENMKQTEAILLHQLDFNSLFHKLRQIS